MIAIILWIISILTCLFAIWFINKVRKDVNNEQGNLTKLQAEINAKQQSLNTLINHIDQSRLESQQLKVEISAQEQQKRNLISDIDNQITAIERLKDQLQNAEQEFKNKYLAERKIWIDERQTEYLKMQSEFIEQFNEDNKKKLLAAQELTNTLDQLKSSVASAVEVAKQEAEQENFIAFHTLNIPVEITHDLTCLSEIIPNLSAIGQEAIAKVIWKIYYEKPYTDLIGRIIGNRTITGIYKITNIHNKMCYVGQAVDIATRWKQHIKQALGAEPRTQNKLYPAMYKEGIQNFTFEIIEECSRNKLNEREDYWQTFYKAKEYGYSIK